MKIELYVNIEANEGTTQLQREMYYKILSNPFIIEWNSPLLPRKGDGIELSFIDKNPFGYRIDRNYECYIEFVYFKTIDGEIIPQLQITCE
jgi:hypothetical protein